MVRTNSSGYQIVFNHLFMAAPIGDGRIPLFDKTRIPQLNGQGKSELRWFPLSELYLRGTRLRPTNEPSRASLPGNPTFVTALPTASIHDISSTYIEHPYFNSNPILCHYEFAEDRGWVLMVYEGRHRIVGANLANRELILGRLVGPEHSLITSQTLPKYTHYYGKPIYQLVEITDLYKTDPTV